MAGGLRSYNLAKGLVALGHDVTVVSSIRPDLQLPGTKVERFHIIDGVKVKWIPVNYNNSMGFWRRVFAFTKFAVLAGIEGRKLTVDVIFATSTPLTIIFPALYSKFRRKTRLIFEVRDLWPELPKAIGFLKSKWQYTAALWMEKLAYDSSNAIIALSPGMKSGVICRGIESSLVAVIPNFCDAKLFEFQASDINNTSDIHGLRQPLVVYIGTFGVMNDVGYLIKLAAETKKIDPSVNFVLIGSGSQKNDLIDLAKSFNVYNDNLLILDPIAKRDLSFVYTKASVVCSVFIDLPEMRANSANKFFDSLAAGKPVLINYSGWQSDLLDEFNVGINAWRKPLFEVANELVYLIKDESALLALGLNAKELGIKYFSKETAIKQLDGIMNFVVTNGTTTPEEIAPGFYRKSGGK